MYIHVKIWFYSTTLYDKALNEKSQLLEKVPLCQDKIGYESGRCKYKEITRTFT